jgi:hypothetical protein
MDPKRWFAFGVGLAFFAVAAVAVKAAPPGFMDTSDVNP